MIKPGDPVFFNAKGMVTDEGGEVIGHAISEPDHHGFIKVVPQMMIVSPAWKEKAETLLNSTQEGGNPEVADENETYRYEYIGNGSNKFWEIRWSGNSLHIRWGRRGTQGQTQTKNFGDRTAARLTMMDKIQEKVSKGYQRRFAAEPKASPPVQAPVPPPGRCRQCGKRLNPGKNLCLSCANANVEARIRAEAKKSSPPPPSLPPKAEKKPSIHARLRGIDI